MMTPEEQLDEARAKEGYREWCEYNGAKGYAPIKVAIRAARLARENWTPPEPVVDPDLVAFREWAAIRWGVKTASAYRLGDCDDTECAAAFLAGARMATERERERAKVLVEYLEEDRGIPAADWRLAKYRGEA